VAVAEGSEVDCTSVVAVLIVRSENTIEWYRLRMITKLFERDVYTYEVRSRRWKTDPARIMLKKAATRAKNKHRVCG
jgi:hypothetical protein